MDRDAISGNSAFESDISFNLLKCVFSKNLLGAYSHGLSNWLSDGNY